MHDVSWLLGIHLPELVSCSSFPLISSSSSHSSSCSLLHLSLPFPLFFASCPALLYVLEFNRFSKFPQHETCLSRFRFLTVGLDMQQTRHVGRSDGNREQAEPGNSVGAVKCICHLVPGNKEKVKPPIKSIQSLVHHRICKAADYINGNAAFGMIFRLSQYSWSS